MKCENTSCELQPVITRVEDFDIQSGNILERLLFNNRHVIVCICAIITVFLGFQASKLQLNASFEKMIPTQHPYIVNYFSHKGDLPGLGNSVKIAVEVVNGSIFEADYLETLRRINDEVFFIPGVDRSAMKSLWTPAVRWFEVTEYGMDGGPVMPDTYNGSEESVEKVRANVEKSGQVGILVAENFKSSMVLVPLLDIDPQTSKPLDYKKLSDSLEELRDKYQNENIKLHIVGFAKIAGDLIEGLKSVIVFFGVAVVIAMLILFWYTRCIRSTILVVVSSIVAVIWQLGILSLMGLDLDPYSMLVPFLIFSIGMSHGGQKMNGIMQDIGRGTHKIIAARYTFRRLFLAGFSALVTDAVGFAVLIIIQIGVIQILAMMASIGVAILIFTNLVLLPILLSFTSVNKKAAARSLLAETADLSGENKHFIWRFLDLFTHRKWAIVTIVVFVIIGLIGVKVKSNLQIGDLDPGAPELRADSRYNRDNAFLVANYAASSDVLVVMVKTRENLCTKYDNLVKVDALEWDLREIPGVESTNSMAAMSKLQTVGMNEGYSKWYGIQNNQYVLNAVTVRSPRELFNQSCNMLSLFVFLKDHKAGTLASVIETVEAFAKKNNSEEIEFLLAAGNSGIEAATNIVVKRSMVEMLYWVYGAVILLCYITFRSVRAVLVAVLPLVLTSILCEALMVEMRIGVKVATLPVIALGVGIGVDYALYVLAIVLNHMREGMSLSAAYYRALLFTGKIVILMGFTLAIGVATWAFSPIKFQADMGLLLAFMFLWNMIGALVLMPALGRFILKEKVTVPEPLPVKEKQSSTITRQELSVKFNPVK